MNGARLLIQFGFVIENPTFESRLPWGSFPDTDGIGDDTGVTGSDTGRKSSSVIDLTFSYTNVLRRRCLSSTNGPRRKNIGGTPVKTSGLFTRSPSCRRLRGRRVTGTGGLLRTSGLRLRVRSAPATLERSPFLGPDS